MISLRYTRNLFLRSFCIVYIFAFVAFYKQIPSLYGDHGILPAKSVLENSKYKTFSAKIHYQPTLLWLAPYLGLDTEYALDVLALLGIFLAFTGFISNKFCTVPLFAGLWSLYFSLYQIGQIFFIYNFDGFLLETGFLALLVAPFFANRGRTANLYQKDSITLWLVRWLLFRFLITCGISKFINDCPKWWSLTAFSYYFETMPLPSPLSWYFHVIPKWYLKLFSVFTNVCELFLPFLIFIPIRSVSITLFFIQTLLQLSIMLTGNFNFQNVLMLCIQLTLLDDEVFWGKKKIQMKWKSFEKIITVFIFSIVVYGIILMYDFKIQGSTIEVNLKLTRDQFDIILKHGLIISIYIGLLSLSFTIFRALTEILFIYNKCSSLKKIFTIVRIIIYSILAIIVFLASSVPLASLHTSSNSTIHTSMHSLYNRVHKLHIVNQYGIFKKMPEERLEIVLEGAYNLDGPWNEYYFSYKPSNLNNSLPFVAPYTPRLDWQMYWTAHNSYDKEPWMLSFIHRLLIGNNDVLLLLDMHNSPFVNKPPKYIRASLYKYNYVPYSYNVKDIWWQRERIGDYFQPFTKDTPALLDYLKARNLLPMNSNSQTVHPIWKGILDKIRFLTAHFEATLLIWSIIIAGCAIITSSSSPSSSNKNIF